MATLNDIDQWFGNDIGVSPTGDLGAAAGLTKGKQRVLRRLLTNPLETTPEGDVLPPDYIFHPDYGAGLARFIGRPERKFEVIGRIRDQMLKEDSVARFPAPVITAEILSDGISVDISYTDNDTGQPATLSFNVNE